MSHADVFEYPALRALALAVGLAMAAPALGQGKGPDLNPDVAQMAPLPVGPTGIRAAQLNSDDFLGISATVRDPAVRRAAWEYIRFMASDEAARIRTRALVEAGYARFANARDLRRFGYSRYLEEIPRNTLVHPSDRSRWTI